MLRMISEKDAAIISVSSDDLSVAEVKDLLSVDGTIGWISNDSFVMGIAVDNQFFVSHWAFNGMVELEELYEAMTSHHKQCRYRATLEKRSYNIIFFFVDRGWVAHALPGSPISTELRSPLKTSWRELETAN